MARMTENIGNQIASWQVLKKYHRPINTAGGIKTAAISRLFECAIKDIRTKSATEMNTSNKARNNSQPKLTLRHCSPTERTGVLLEVVAGLTWTGSGVGVIVVGVGYVVVGVTGAGVTGVGVVITGVGIYGAERFT